MVLNVKSVLPAALEKVLRRVEAVHEAVGALAVEAEGDGGVGSRAGDVGCVNLDLKRGSAGGEFNSGVSRRKGLRPAPAFVCGRAGISREAFPHLVLQLARRRRLLLGTKAGAGRRVSSRFDKFSPLREFSQLRPDTDWASTAHCHDPSRPERQRASCSVQRWGHSASNYRAMFLPARLGRPGHVNALPCLLAGRAFADHVAAVPGLDLGSCMVVGVDPSGLHGGRERAGENETPVL